jgi:hypothetical protein
MVTKMKKKLISVLSMTLAITFLAACGAGAPKTSDSTATKAGIVPVVRRVIK